jgi:hypothetical protein
LDELHVMIGYVSEQAGIFVGNPSRAIIQQGGDISWGQKVQDVEQVCLWKQVKQSWF